MSCRICGNDDGNKTHSAREMMFGTREEFNYVECGGCGCVQIEPIPGDLSRHYPEGYYSLRNFPGLWENRVRSLARRLRADYCLTGRGWLGRFLALKLGVPDYYAWLRRSGVGFDSRILDAGCGTGRLLEVLRREGFSDLTGADPFIEKDLLYASGVKVLKSDMSRLEGGFDFIMMNHAFEHMPDPAATLGQVRRLLRPGRAAMIRIPVASSHAWRKYGVNWVQLDPPRHLYLHTVESMERLARDSGLVLEDVVHDSDDFQFWGSEQYVRGIPLTDQRSLFVDPGSDLFSKEDRGRFRREAEELNRRKEGDQAAFWLRKA